MFFLSQNHGAIVEHMGGADISKPVLQSVALWGLSPGGFCPHNTSPRLLRVLPLEVHLKLLPTRHAAAQPISFVGLLQNFGWLYNPPA